MATTKTDAQKYRFEKIPAGDMQQHSFLLFETRYYAKKYLKERVLPEVDAFDIEGKCMVEHEIIALDGGFVILRVVKYVI